MTEVFWRKGLASTSLDDLSEATGLARPSLYNTFGDKNQMFERAQIEFSAKMERRFEKVLTQEGELRDILNAFFDTALYIYSPKDGEALGCFVNAVGATAVPLSDPLREQISNTNTAAERQIYLRMDRARQKGEISRTVDLRAVSAICMTMLSGLSIRARSGASVDELRTIAHDFTDGIMVNLKVS